MSNTTKGNYYEDIALQYLLSLDFIFIDKNFHCKYGEIDLIMQKNDILHFIEVKSCSSFYPTYNITAKKIEKLTKTIYLFLTKHNLTLDFCIDAVSIYGNKIELIENITL